MRTLKLVSRMSDQLYGYIEADSETDSSIYGLEEHLEVFLESLARQVIIPQSIRCPLIYPSDDGDISLRWSEPEHEHYMDINLATLNAKYTVISAHGVLCQESYNLKHSPSDWKSFAEKASQWIAKEAEA